MNYIIGGVIEVLGATFSNFSVSSKRLARRYSTIIDCYLITALCLVLGGLTFVETHDRWKVITVGVIALVTKGIAVGLTAAIFIYGAELFPTVVRSSAIGLLGFASRSGGLVAPQFILLVSGRLLS